MTDDQQRAHAALLILNLTNERNAIKAHATELAECLDELCRIVEGVVLERWEQIHDLMDSFTTQPGRNALAKHLVNAEPSASTQSAGTMESALNPGPHYVARWMVAHGYATGHGDTIDDLLQHLVREVAETSHEIGTVNGNPGAAELTATGSRACGGSGVRPPAPAGSGSSGGPAHCAHGVPLTIYDATNTSADCSECAKECLAVGTGYDAFQWTGDLAAFEKWFGARLPVDFGGQISVPVHKSNEGQWLGPWLRVWCGNWIIRHEDRCHTVTDAVYKLLTNPVPSQGKREEAGRG